MFDLKAAQKKAHHKWYVKNRELVLEKNKRYRLANPEKCKEVSRRWRQQHPERHKASVQRWQEKNSQFKRDWWLRRYGINLKQYEALVALQNGQCAICAGDGGRRGLCVDHCHTTNIIRGLLCNECNLILGYAKDDIKILEAAREYLGKFI